MGSHMLRTAGKWGELGGGLSTLEIGSEDFRDEGRQCFGFDTCRAGFEED